MTHPRSRYKEYLEELGYYRHGEPAAGVLSAQRLLKAVDNHDPAAIDRAFKYQTILDDRILGVTDIFEVDGSPCIYFKHVPTEPTYDQIIRWHRSAWNHGLAPMLWLVTPTHIRIYNAYASPKENVPITEDRDIELFSRILTDLRRFKVSLARRKIESGEFWVGRIGSRIQKKGRIDHELVNDLSAAATKLVQTGMRGTEANKLLLRTIFVAYLEARRIIPSGMFQERGAKSFEEVLDDPENTNCFFDQMKETFDGDLFPPQAPHTVQEHVTLSREQRSILQDILQGTSPTTGQRSLEFSRYDFGVIPIELISSIGPMHLTQVTTSCCGCTGKIHLLNHNM